MEVDPSRDLRFPDHILYYYFELLQIGSKSLLSKDDFERCSVNIIVKKFII